ncbi:MAG: 3-hydroxyacyl-CoA dehydrogenase [Burkholderiaceae bacterium]|nr:3-hydroxyacyl-CoA dehydrogenase [Burkholderiaceae bacterium]
MKIGKDSAVLVVGAGIMGAGIAQVAAQAGHSVFLHDAREGAAAQARDKLGATLQGLVAKGKLAVDAAEATIARVRPVAALAEAAGAAIAVEAIVEDLQAKRALFAELEALLGADAVLATNTSSISVTAIANGMQRPGRLVGMHFFNPVPLMKLVEVVSGLRTDGEVAQAVFDLAAAWGKTPVHAKSTPGFVVNRIARPFYAEALQLLLERAAEPAVLDACLRGAGFRMGPCELIDLIGHDTNFAVTRSVYEANFEDKRYMPSLLQAEMVAGGLLGRKSGQGFYRYGDGGGVPALPAFEPASAPYAQRVVLHGAGPVADRLTLALAGQAFERDTASGWTGLEVDGAQLRLTDGRCASAIGAEVAVFDLPIHPSLGGCERGTALAFALSDRASGAWVQAAAQWLRAAGFHAQRIADAPGLIVARTLAMLINEACDAVHQGVCSEAGADAAMKLGVNYPAGPFEWLARWDAARIAQLLDALAATYRGERYRVSPALRRRSWA